MIKQLFISPSCKILPTNRFIYNWYSCYSTNKPRKSIESNQKKSTTTTTTSTPTPTSTSTSSSKSQSPTTDQILFEQFQKSVIKNDIKHNPNNQPFWMKRNRTIKSKHSHWNPTKKLSRLEMNKLRELKQYFPHFTTADLGKIFHISPESVRRILKSKYIPDDD